MSALTNDRWAALKRRVRRFYALLNDRRFADCHRLIDPRLLEKPGKGTSHQYEQALGEFLDAVGEVRVLRVTITAMYVNEPSKLYEGRDFALGRTTWEDAAGDRHEFAERWVYDGTGWFTRSTGLLKPAEAAPAEAVPSEK